MISYVIAVIILIFICIVTLVVKIQFIINDVVYVNTYGRKYLELIARTTMYIMCFGLVVGAAYLLNTSLILWLAIVLYLVIFFVAIVSTFAMAIAHNGTKQSAFAIAYFLI
jgi:hypothetical protein